MRSRVKVTITIQTENELGELTTSERWDVISAAMIATRAAIEQYVEPKNQRNVIDAMSTLMRAPMRPTVKVSQRMTTMEKDS